MTWTLGVFEEPSHIRWLVRFLIQTYFINLRGILVVYNSDDLTSVKMSYMDGISDTVDNGNNFAENFVLQWINVKGLSSSDFNELMLKNAELGTQGYISLLNNSLRFLDSKYNATERSATRQMAKKFLFLTESEDPITTLQAKLFGWYPSHLFVQPVETEAVKEVRLWTQRFVGVDNSDDAVLLDVFYENRTFQKNANLYPDKFTNMQGRVLKISTTTNVPYVITKNVKPGEGLADSVNTTDRDIVLEGIEGCLIHLFCEMRNCSLKVQDYGPDNIGDIYENGSSEGLIGALYRKEVDFGICSLFTWFADFFDSSHVIAKSVVKILVPAPSRYPEYLSIILPFTPVVWLLVLSSVIFSAIMYHVLRKLLIKLKIEKDIKPQTYTHTFFQIIAIYFQQGIGISQFQRYSARLCLTALLLSAMIIENTYGGALKSFLTIPKYYDPVDTIEKFIKSDWKWGAPHIAWIYSLQGSDNYKDVELIKSFEVRTYEELRNLSLSRNFGIAIEQLNGRSYAFGAYVKEDAVRNLIVIKDDIYSDYSRGNARYGWPLMETFNTIVMWIGQHGILSALEAKTVRDYLDTKTVQAVTSLRTHQKSNPEPVVMNISHISSQLFLLFLGCFAASVIFICELLCHRFPKNHKERQDDHRELHTASRRTQ